jgi:hypothetical protein
MEQSIDMCYINFLKLIFLFRELLELNAPLHSHEQNVCIQEYNLKEESNFQVQYWAV